MHHNRKYFSKVKVSKVYKDKIFVRMLGDKTRENMLKGDMHREDYHEDKAHIFLCLVKIRQTTQVD